MVTAIAIVAGGLCAAEFQADQSTGVRSSDANVRPLLLERDEGELRTRGLHTDGSSPAASQFMLKVSPKNNGSQHLVAGTELLAPGATLPKHRHLLQDEILLIQTEPPTCGSASRSAISMPEDWCLSRQIPG
jgi:hypothetical protein